MEISFSSWRCYLRTRKFRINPLLDRNQLVFDVIHPGKSSISKKEVQEQIALTYFADPNLIVVFGLRSTFGGQGSSGFAFIYHNLRAMQSFEPKHRNKQTRTNGPRFRRKMIKNELKRKRALEKKLARIRSGKIDYYSLRGSW